VLIQGVRPGARVEPGTEQLPLDVQHKDLDAEALDDGEHPGDADKRGTESGQADRWS
jgi:hypothetical protein